MKIILIGNSGTIGRRVEARLAERHELIRVSRSAGDLRVDIGDAESIVEMFRNVGIVDAVVCIAGEAKWASFESMSEEDFFVGLRSKLMGQVNLVRLGVKNLAPNGSFTLTTGILADDPVLSTSSPAMVNGAIHSFVRAVSLELPIGIRINAVSCGLVEDSLEKYSGYFPGHNAIPMHKVVNAYVRSVEGRDTGKVITAYDNR